jgi:hypothetical protein
VTGFLGRFMGLGLIALAVGGGYWAATGEQADTLVFMLLFFVAFGVVGLIVRQGFWRIHALRPALHWLYPYDSWTGAGPGAAAARRRAVLAAPMDDTQYERERARRRALWSFIAAIFVWFMILPTNAVLAPILAVVTVVAMNLYLRRRDAKQDERDRLEAGDEPEDAGPRRQV